MQAVGWSRGVPQRTIGDHVKLVGLGLHSGTATEVICRAAPPDAGIIFRRVDRPGSSPIPARIGAVSDLHRGVTLGQGVVVRTVEHLLAAATALGLTNLSIEVNGEELPALDGSAEPYYDAFQRAGVVEQREITTVQTLAGPVWVQAPSAWLLGLPAPRLHITYIVPIKGGQLETQVANFELGIDDFAEQIAPARTWGYVEELDTLRKAGLALGATSDNALGIGRDGYLSQPRFPDEPARHKVLDLLGDLALLGRPLDAHVIALGAGHALHVEFARRIAAGH